MVIVKLNGTFWYGPRGDKRRYGPGDAVVVPEGLANALGLTPMAPPAPLAPPPASVPAPIPAYAYILPPPVPAAAPAKKPPQRPARRHA